LRPSGPTGPGGPCGPGAPSAPSAPGGPCGPGGPSLFHSTRCSLLLQESSGAIIWIVPLELFTQAWYTTGPPWADTQVAAPTNKSANTKPIPRIRLSFIVLLLSLSLLAEGSEHAARITSPGRILTLTLARANCPSGSTPYTYGRIGITSSSIHPSWRCKKPRQIRGHGRLPVAL
jgi:hypothetical protein